MCLLHHDGLLRYILEGSIKGKRTSAKKRLHTVNDMMIKILSSGQKREAKKVHNWLINTSGSEKPAGSNSGL